MFFDFLLWLLKPQYNPPRPVPTISVQKWFYNLPVETKDIMKGFPPQKQGLAGGSGSGKVFELDEKGNITAIY